MPHASNTIAIDGPDSPHAFDLVPVLPRNGSLDAECPVCHGHGQWNVELDLVSFRCKRAICARCNGAGWVETGSDPVGFPDIERLPGEEPHWTVRYVPRDEADDAPPPDDAGLTVPKA